MGERRKKIEERGLNYFFKTEARVKMTFDVLRYLEAKGENGVTFSNLDRDMTKNRLAFISGILIPNGYAKKAVRFRKQLRDGKPYYQRTVKYYITSEGEDFILDLENKYKEHKMKTLYGRIL